MKDHELVEATLDEFGFSYFIVSLPQEVIEDKLAIASPNTGLICRIEYQNSIFSECIVNIERMFKFLAETSGGDPEHQIALRNKIELAICLVNPGLSPGNLLITKSGVIKPKPGNTGIPLTDNADWEKIIEDMNPYIVVEEYEILDDPQSFIPPDNEESSFFNQVDTVKKEWDRTGIELTIRKYSKKDLSSIFSGNSQFSNKVEYKVHIINQCIVDAQDVFILADSILLTEEIQIGELADELYLLCIAVNPFLKSGEINLDDLRKANLKVRKNRKSVPKTTKENVKESFSDVSKEELLTLSSRIKKHVVGQDAAIDQIVETIQIASCGLRDPEKPIAVHLLCGTTGCGKTYSSKVLAEELCGSRDNMVRIDCSEYTREHDVQKLIGAPPSYVGHEDGGFLTNAVSKNPFSIVLFDEVEKAHSKFFDLLLQIMDDARLTDGKGVTSSFKDCVILLTSNIGVVEAEEVKRSVGFGDDAVLTEERRGKALNSALKNRFRPEFLNRIDSTINFNTIGKDEAISIVSLLLETVQGYLKVKGIESSFTSGVKNMIFEKGFSKKYGARPLQRAIDTEVVRPLAQMLLKDEVVSGDHIKVDFKKGQLKITTLKKKTEPPKNKATVSKKKTVKKI